MLGHWCGYVGVPKEHPEHNKEYDDVSLDAHIHGGLTFSGRRAKQLVPKELHDMWWFGFDCAHDGDIVPKLLSTCPQSGEYRTLKYVRKEIATLASELAQRSKHASTHPEGSEG